MSLLYVFCLFTCSKWNYSTRSTAHFLNSDIKTVFYLLKNVKTFSMRRKDTLNLALRESYSYEISKYCHLIKLDCRGWSKRGAHSSGPINQVLCCANRFHPNQSQKTARPQIRQTLYFPLLYFLVNGHILVMSLWDFQSFPVYYINCSCKSNTSFIHLTLRLPAVYEPWCL